MMDQRYPNKTKKFSWDNYIVGVRVNTNGGYQFIMSNEDNKLFSDSYSNRIYRDYIIPEEIKKVRVRFNKRDAKLCGLKFWCSGANQPIAV